MKPGVMKRTMLALFRDTCNCFDSDFHPSGMSVKSCKLKQIGHRQGLWLHTAVFVAFSIKRIFWRLIVRLRLKDATSKKNWKSCNHIFDAHGWWRWVWPFCCVGRFVCYLRFVYQNWSRFEVWDPLNERDSRRYCLFLFVEMTQNWQRTRFQFSNMSLVCSRRSIDMNSSRWRTLFFK